GTQVPFYLRHWVSVLALATADLLSFGLAAFLFRVWHREPQIWLGGHRALSVLGHSLDVFALLAVLFIFLRALAGDYSRREPFWDGVRVTIQALFLISLPDLISVVLFHARYSASGAVASWISLAFFIPALRQCARMTLCRFGLWQRRAALVGSGPAAETVYSVLSKSLSLGFDIRWVVALSPHAEVPAGLSELKTMISADARDVGLLVQAAGCEQAILAMSDAEQSAYPELVQRLNEANVETAIIPPLARLPF